MRLQTAVTAAAAANGGSRVLNITEDDKPSYGREKSPGGDELQSLDAVYAFQEYLGGRVAGARGPPFAPQGHGECGVPRASVATPRHMAVFPAAAGFEALGGAPG